jgi:hypothetical protein
MWFERDGIETGDSDDLSFEEKNETQRLRIVGVGF